MLTDRFDRYALLAALPMSVAGTSTADVIASGASMGPTDLSVTPDGTPFASSLLFSYDDILFVARGAQFLDYLGSAIVLGTRNIGTTSGTATYSTVYLSRGASFWSSVDDEINTSDDLGQGMGIDRTWVIDLGGDVSLTFDFNYDLAFSIRTSIDDEGPFGTTFIINSWSYTVENSSTPVPGPVGLAALACGAAGLRRKRSRIA